jgi:succinoglycan biosynthesis transport protein ExoP
VPEVEQLDSGSFDGPNSPASQTLGAQIDLVTKILRRRYLIVLICMLVSLVGGAAFLYTAKPMYTASATMLLEAKKTPFADSLLGNSSGPDAAGAWFESQMMVLKSQPVVAYVVKQLRLADDPQFLRSENEVFDRVLARLGWGKSVPQSDAERFAAAVQVVMDGLGVKRTGPSYVVQIDFRSPNAEQGTKIANALIDGYISDQLNAKYQANRRAGDWLQERLQALREQAAAAERAVLEYKAKNNIVSAGGTLMSDKQLSETSGQLAAARARTSDTQARLDRIQAVRQVYQQDQPPASDADETVSEAMSNAIIGGLQARYLELKNREIDWTVRYGKNHKAVETIRNQIRAMRRSIRDELGRIEETHRSELEIAKKRQDELEQGVAKLISQSTNTNQAQVILFSLEAAAQSYRKLYDNFLQRQTESVQQQSWPISDARPVSPAFATKTSPRPGMVWMVAVFVGGILGVGIAGIREIADRGFRTRDQVRSVLGTECLALVPLLTRKRRLLMKSRQNGFSGWQALPAPRSRRGDLAMAGSGAEPRCIGAAPEIMHTILDQPSSLYAEAIRAIKLTVDQKSEGEDAMKIVGLTSSLASEGKSSIAAAMATLIARSGARVILIDADVRNPTLSRALAPDASVGLLDVMVGAAPLADAIWTDPASNLSFLPTFAKGSLPHATEILASESARSLFNMLKIKFDYVIVDLAPLAAGMDVRAVSNLIGSYLLVIEWGATKRDAVQYALSHAPGVRANLVGAVLNKVDLAGMSRYDSHGVDYYYGRSRYARPIN